MAAPSGTVPTPGLDITKTPEYHMFCFKILSCPLKTSHDWSSCPWAHPKEQARRRDPRRFYYTPMMCPYAKMGAFACPKGDACDMAHQVYEFWLHPLKFRSEMCRKGPLCDRRLCFFAHRPEELRSLTQEQLIAAGMMAPPHGSQARAASSAAMATGLGTIPGLDPATGAYSQTNNDGSGVLPVGGLVAPHTMANGHWEDEHSLLLAAVSGQSGGANGGSGPLPSPLMGVVPAPAQGAGGHDSGLLPPVSMAGMLGGAACVGMMQDQALFGCGTVGSAHHHAGVGQVGQPLLLMRPAMYEMPSHQQQAHHGLSRSTSGMDDDATRSTRALLHLPMVDSLASSHLSQQHSQQQLQLHHQLQRLQLHQQQQQQAAQGQQQFVLCSSPASSSYSLLSAAQLQHQSSNAALLGLQRQQSSSSYSHSSHSQSAPLSKVLATLREPVAPSDASSVDSGDAMVLNPTTMLQQRSASETLPRPAPQLPSSAAGPSISEPLLMFLPDRELGGTNPASRTASFTCAAAGDAAAAGELQLRALTAQLQELTDAAAAAAGDGASGVQPAAAAGHGAAPRLHVVRALASALKLELSALGGRPGSGDVNCAGAHQWSTGGSPVGGSPGPGR